MEFSKVIDYATGMSPKCAVVNRVKFISFVFPLIMINLVSANSHASDGCENPKSQYDRTYCFAKLFVESDKELNEVYSSLKKELKDAQKKKLTEVQREWLKFRDTQCANAGTINVDCNYSVNKSRTEFLRDRYRECKVGHCRNDLLFQSNWEAGQNVDKK